MRCAPQTWIACAIDSGPYASPAWMVTLMLLSRTSWNAALWCLAGWSYSAPARSKPTTPRPLYATASSAISSELSGETLRMPQMMTFDSMPMLVLRRAQALEHALDDGRELEAAARVEHRRVAHLHVADVLARGVLGELVGDAPERLLGLHHAQRDVEGLEVLDERAAVLPEVHRRAEARPRRRPGSSIAVLLGEVEDRREAERAVEVDVQVGLRELLDELERNGSRGLGLGHSQT